MKSINEKAPVKCRKEITISAPADKVWQVLTTINQWPAWNPEIKATSINGPLAPETGFDWLTGGTKIHSTIHTVEPATHFGWTGKVMGVFAIHNWHLTGVGQTTTVAVEESMEGILTRLLKGSFNKSLEKGMTNWLLAMKKECEK
jgi:hypothetical protein